MGDGDRCARVLCSKKALLPPPSSREPGVRWLIGSHRFLPRFTVVSSLHCLHALPHDPFSPDFAREADDLKVLLLKGFDVIGALYVCSGNWEENARKAIDASRKMGKLLLDDEGNYDMIGSTADLVTGDVHFFASEATKLNYVEAFNTVVYEDNPEKYLWENGCFLRCELAFKLPVYIPATTTSDIEEAYSSTTAAVATQFRDPQVVYLVEGSNAASNGISNSLVLHGADLDFSKGNSGCMPVETSRKESSAEALLCSMFCKNNERVSSSKENAETVQITVLSNFSRNNSESTAPMAEYFPASEPARLVIVDFKLDVLSYAAKDFPVAAAVSKLIVPGLADQLNSMRKAFIPYLLAQHPQLCAYHFLPQGILHPITAIYDVRYGETELKQVEVRKSLHSRLGLPLDRPLLLVANALTFNNRRINGSTSLRNASSLLKDVHTEIPSSGVSGGMISLVDGSYQYYHYLHDGFDDNGWGCAYRSLQTIISWFRLQNYTSIEVPSHREIQQALVEIGDKEPSFVGSREWIGAIELSFVLDKLLGVTCRIINVRSGEELPEKCRELSMHFETQGTPIMIGGGVLAYTLLGVDFNEVTGDSAFLILDPHYTGSDDLKKIVNGGWCGWKKSVDSKGRSFFLKDKFYNLLLPQRPTMV